MATRTQQLAWEKIHALCQLLATAVPLVRSAEVQSDPESASAKAYPMHADVLLEWYDAVSEMREHLETEWDVAAPF
jgi:hypothetical protein